MTKDRFLLEYSDDGVPDFTPIEENLEATCTGGMIQVRKYPTGIKVHQEECLQRKKRKKRKSTQRQVGYSMVCSMLCLLYPQELETIGDIEKWNKEGSRIWVDQYAIKPPRDEVQEED